MVEAELLVLLQVEATGRHPQRVDVEDDRTAANGGGVVLDQAGEGRRVGPLNSQVGKAHLRPAQLRRQRSSTTYVGPPDHRVTEDRDLRLERVKRALGVAKRAV